MIHSDSDGKLDNTFTLRNFDPPETKKDIEKNKSFDSEESLSTDNSSPIIHKIPSFEALKTNSENPLGKQQFGVVHSVADDSLLTNIEEYSSKIRKEADDYLDLKKAEADKLLSEAQQEVLEQNKQKDAAIAEKESLIAEAQKTVISIQKAADEKGKQEGLEKGMLEVKEQLIPQLEVISNIIKELEELKKSLFIRNEEEIILLSNIVAKKIVAHELRESSGHIKAHLEDALSTIEQTGIIRIKVHPSDLEFIKELGGELSQYLEDDQKISFKADPNIEPTGVVIETDFSIVDMQISELFKHSDELLMNLIEERKIEFKNSKK